MYWIRTNNPAQVLLIVMLTLIIWSGGWLVARHSFKLNTKERLVVGLGIGIGVYIALVNILGHFLEPDWAFWLGGLLTLTLGLSVGIRSSEPLVGLEDFNVVPQLATFLLMVLVFTLIGRGLGIFDERKNLSIISTMAAGDIPPHFYMNSTFNFSYHYGSQLFSAALMRVGGLFPWSAFDIGKGIMAALALNLAYLWGRRQSMRSEGGLLLAGWIAFASGARWMLLLLPASVVLSMGAGLTLWGTGSESAVELSSGLSAPWIIDGGPPIPIPFAYVNGILQPFVLHAQAGPKSLALVMFLVVLFLIKSPKRHLSGVVVFLMFSTWALAAEAEFVLFSLGVFAVGLVLRFWKGGDPWQKELRFLVLIAGIAVLMSFIQGGTLTEFASGYVGGRQPAGVSGGFSLRYPPAIVSSHLGELHLFEPGDLAVALFELGPILLLLPLLTIILIRSLRRRNSLQSVLALSAAFGFIIPLVLSYSVDRDITRLMNYSLYVAIIVCSGILLRLCRAYSSRLAQSVFFSIVILSSLGGVVVLGSLMTAFPQAVFADEIEPLDARMARDYWDVLPDDSEVLDSSTWRAVAITGRLTRSASDSTTFLASWEALKADPIVTDVEAGGYDYVYVDKVWWETMPKAAQDSYQAPCVRLVGEAYDNNFNGARWLFDIRQCSP